MGGQPGEERESERGGSGRNAGQATEATGEHCTGAPSSKRDVRDITLSTNELPVDVEP